MPKQLLQLIAFIGAILLVALHCVQQEGLSKCFVQDARANAGAAERAILGAVSDRGLQACTVEELAVAHLLDLVGFFQGRIANGALSSRLLRSQRDILIYGDLCDLEQP